MQCKMHRHIYTVWPGLIKHICIRLESFVNTAREATETILPQCHASLADSGGASDQGRGCGYIYRMFHCYPSDSLIEKSRGTLDTIPELNC